MGQPIPTKLAEFDNGMTTLLRSGDVSKASSVSMFDNYSNPLKLTPHRSMKLDTTTESTFDIYRITKIITTPSGIFGSGVISDSDAHAQVYIKVTASDPTSIWTTASSGSNASLGGSAGGKLFVLYHNYLYLDNATGIAKYGDITSSPSFTYNDYTSHIPTGQGRVIGGILYVPSGQYLLQNDLLHSTGWAVALDFSTGVTIAEIAETVSGDVALALNYDDGTSKVAVWNLDTSQPPYQIIPWGNGSLKHIFNIGGAIVGISVSSSNLTSLNPMVYFKVWNGSRLVPFEVWSCTVATFLGEKQSFNDLHYFLAEITMNGTAFKGVWKIFQKPTGQYAVSFDRAPRNDTVLDAGTLRSFQRIGDYMFISYLVPATGKYTVWRTDDQANYLATSVFETIILNSVLGLRNKHIPDSSQYKDFMGASITSPALPSGASVALKYKIDADSSWSTAILTHNTQNAISASIVGLAARVPQHKELYLRLESTGGAEITSVDLLQDVTDKKPY